MFAPFLERMLVVLLSALVDEMVLTFFWRSPPPPPPLASAGLIEALVAMTAAARVERTVCLKVELNIFDLRKFKPIGLFGWVTVIGRPGARKGSKKI